MCMYKGLLFSFLLRTCFTPRWPSVISYMFSRIVKSNKHVAEKYTQDRILTPFLKKFFLMCLIVITYSKYVDTQKWRFLLFCYSYNPTSICSKTHSSYSNSFMCSEKQKDIKLEQNMTNQEGAVLKNRELNKTAAQRNDPIS